MPHLYKSINIPFMSLYLMLQFKGRDSAPLIQKFKLTFHVFVCLFDSILCVSSTIFQLNRDGSSWVEPVLSKDECVLLKDHNAVTPVRLKPVAYRSRVKHSTTDPLCSLSCLISYAAVQGGRIVPHLYKSVNLPFVSLYLMPMITGAE